MLLAAAAGISPTNWLRWDCHLGRFSLSGRAKAVCKTPAAKHCGADCASSESPVKRKPPSELHRFFPQICSCGTGICLCLQTDCSQALSAQRATELSAADLPACAQITSELGFTLACFKMKTPVGLSCQNSLHFFPVKNLITSLFTADTSCSSLKLIHVDMASPKGLRVKCVKCFELSSKGTAERQSLCCIKS